MDDSFACVHPISGPNLMAGHLWAKTWQFVLTGLQKVRESALSGSKPSSQDTKVGLKEKLIWFYWWPTKFVSSSISLERTTESPVCVRLAWITGLWDLWLCSSLWFFLWQATFLDSIHKIAAQKRVTNRTQWLF